MTLPAVGSAVTLYLDRHRIDVQRVVPLTGDASDRRYVRVVPRSGPSFVLAVHSAPFDRASLPFIQVARLLAAMPVPIPHVVGDAPDLGVLALDDLGDVTLQAHVEATSPAVQVAMYREAISLIGVIQRRGRELADSRLAPYGLAFDEAKLMWEMDFFIRHFLEAYRGVQLPAPAAADLRAELAVLAGELAAEPRVLCHRDYHSRNLMVHDGALFVIDFQDARMGPDTYDLVSLLRDSYVDLPEQLVDEGIDHFLGDRPSASDRVRFRERFDLMAVQRNLKALGTFGFQATSRTNAVYLQYIPRTLRYVRENLYKYDRFARLREILGQSLAELRP